MEDRKTWTGGGIPVPTYDTPVAEQKIEKVIKQLYAILKQIEDINSKSREAQNGTNG
jgi:hypothetical protein